MQITALTDLTGRYSVTTYLDHAASTPLRVEAREAWIDASGLIGNPSSIHGAGQQARRVLEQAREDLALVLDCEPIEIVFTSGGTESINGALKGLWEARTVTNPAAVGAIVLPDGEHHASIDCVGWLVQSHGAQVRSIPLDGKGRISLAHFRDELPGAVLATAIVANNEVGTRNDAGSLAAVSAEANVPLHLDAVSAFGHVPVSFSGWRGDANKATGLVAMSVSAHKVGGPLGMGAVVVSRTAKIAPLAHGGSAQRGLRAGTQDFPAAVAFAAAARAAENERRDEAVRLTAMRRELVHRARQLVPDMEMLGDSDDRIPGNVSLLFPRAEGESMLFLMDQAGVSVSTGSACQAGVAEPSHVVRALGRNDADARAVLRVTMGHTTTQADVEAFLAALPDVHARAVASRARAAARS